MSKDVVDVFVEIPKGSRNKYEIDKKTGHIRLDRRLFTATTYPGDYGFITETHGEDGDALDAVVLVEDATFPGCVITAKPLGVFRMEDEAGPDAKIICVPHTEPRWEMVEDLQDLPKSVVDEIGHFFEVYKMLEPRKKTTTAGFGGREEALKEIREARERFRSRHP